MLPKKLLDAVKGTVLTIAAEERRRKKNDGTDLHRLPQGLQTENRREKRPDCDGQRLSARGGPTAKELLHPTRTVTSTVKITGGLHRRLPVKTTGKSQGARPQRRPPYSTRWRRAPHRGRNGGTCGCFGHGVDFVATRDM